MLDFFWYTRLKITTPQMMATAITTRETATTTTTTTVLFFSTVASGPPTLLVSANIRIAVNFMSFQSKSNELSTNFDLMSTGNQYRISVPVNQYQPYIFSTALFHS